MEQTFVQWLKSFNEKMGRRQVRMLQRIRCYLEDKRLRIDDQISIRQRAIKHWFYTQSGQKFIVLDEKFGYRYVANLKMDYRQRNNYVCERPLHSLIVDKELLRRIQFEQEKSTTQVHAKDFSRNGGEFCRYQVRGDWFTIAFEFKANEDKYPPKWVTLISAGNRQIFECDKSSGDEMMCFPKTNDLMRLP